MIRKKYFNDTCYKEVYSHARDKHGTVHLCGLQQKRNQHIHHYSRKSKNGGVSLRNDRYMPLKQGRHCVAFLGWASQYSFDQGVC